MLNNGERQVAPSVDGIRRDHVARYEWAASQLPPGSRVLDLACGVGYGAWILAQAGHHVVAMDKSHEAISYAREHYLHPNISFCYCDAEEDLEFHGCDAVVCFETLEHLKEPLLLLKKFHAAAPILLASVPNEEVFPYQNIKFHHRHYTREQFKTLLGEAGFLPIAMFGQAGPHSEVEAGCNGRTVIAYCQRKPEGSVQEIETPKASAPQHVVILGLGPSLESYLDHVKRLGSRHAFADEVWAINALGDIVQCDRIFHMDDVRIQEQRAKLLPDSNIAQMVRWLKKHPGPIYTSRAHPDYPGLVEFPLQEVLNDGGFAYFNSTAAYAIAYAMHIGVKQISLFGLDYTLPNAHNGEKGRACCEFWLGLAAARGILINISEKSSMMDACEPDDQKLYGYDCVDVTITDDADGRAQVAFKEKASIPTAEEIERRYDHSKHPNPLMRR